MDPPYIRQSRYVTITSPPPPPPPSNPNFYRPVIYHQPNISDSNNNNYLPPPPPPNRPPPPLPQQLRHNHHQHLPPPPPPPRTGPPPVTKVSFNSHHSEFQFSPNLGPNPNPKTQSQYHHQRDNDFDRRISINNDRRQQRQENYHHQQHRQRLIADFDGRPDVWDWLPRSLPDHHPVVSHLDHRQFDHRPMSPYRPMDKSKNELDTSSRFRELYINDGVQFENRSSNYSNQKAEFVPNRSHFVSDSDRLNWSSYDKQRGSQFDSSELMRNNVRDVILDRQVLRERESRDSLFGRGSNCDNGDSEVRAFSGKRDFNGSDLGRYGNNKGSRENSYEYDRTPRKQVQKKSALLRIQKPYHIRNQEDGEFHFSGYEIKSRSFRGKDQDVFSECKLGETEPREGSPVELDISFKSNAMVGKTIMAPSNSTIVSDANSTPTKGNTRKIMMSDKDYLSSPMNKPLDSSRKLDGTVGAVNKALDSDNKDSKQSKNSPAKFTVEKSKGIVPEKWGTGVGTTKTSSLKVVTKKKVVKKVVKKAINPKAHVSSSQPTEKLDQSGKADGSTLDAPAAMKMGVKPSECRITSAAMASGHQECFQPCAIEANMLPGNDQESRCPQAAMVSEEVSPDEDSCVLRDTKIKRKRSESLSPLASSSHKETKNDEVHADKCLLVLQTALNTEKDANKLLNENDFSVIGSVEGADNQFCHNGHSLLPENADTKESPETLLSEKRNINSDLSTLGENKRHDGLVSICNFTQGSNTTTCFNNGLLSTQEKITNSDVCVQNASSNQPRVGQMSPSVSRNTAERFPLVIPPGKCEISALSCLEETGIHNVSEQAGCSNLEKSSISGSDNVNISSEEITPDASSFNGGKLERNEVTFSLENGAAEGFPNSIFSVGSSEKDISNNTDKSKPLMPLSDLPDAMVNDRYMGHLNANRSVQSVNAALSFSVKDCCPVEISYAEGSDTGVRSCSDGLSVFRGHNSIGGSCEANVADTRGLNEDSPGNRKRRKVSALHTGFTSMIASEIREAAVTPDVSKSGAEFSSNSIEGLIQPEEEVAVSKFDTLSDSTLPLYPDGVTVLLENGPARASSEVAVSVSRDATRFGDDSLKVEPLNSHSSSALGEEDTEIALPICLQGSDGKQIVNENQVMDGSNYNNEVMCTENKRSENMEAFSVEEQVKACSEAIEFGIPPENQSPHLLNQLLPAADVVSEGCLFEKGDLSSASTYGALAADGDGISTTNSNDELMEFESLSNMGSPEISSTVPVMSVLNHEASTSQISSEKVCGIDKIPNEKPEDEGTSNLSPPTSPSEHEEINLKLDRLLENARFDAGRAVSLPVQDVKGIGHNLNPIRGDTYWKKNQPSHSVSRVPPKSSSSVFTASRNAASATHTTNPRSWHRTVPPPDQFPKKVSKLKFQSMSYIRKGNSLVRKPAPVAALPPVSHGLTSSVYRLNSSGIGESKKTRGPESSADVINPPNFLRMGVNAPLERPRTPPLPVVSKVPKHATNSIGDCTSSPVAEPVPSGYSETSDPQKFMEINDEPGSVKISETLVKPTGSDNSLESHGELNDGTLSTSNVKRITYLKRKSNQLIAASNDCGLCVQNPDKTQSITSDGFYKRRKNQLIRTPLESRINQTISLADGSFSSEGEKGAKDIFRISSNKNQSYKAIKKNCKPLRFSLVWTLNSMQSAKSDDLSSYRQKVFPYLFPWKRTVYWRRFVQDAASISNNSSLSAISRRLLQVRKRDAVYTRSNHGFSLRKSKVLSVGCSSLKWSKSIESRSKKANEEATLAVAAVEKKRQQNGAESFACETKKRSLSCRERIFRIGSVRYKMDSSRQTLQRMSDDESSCAGAPNSEKNANRSYIPRRLVIGIDEYVQVGNGNQLVRDPKKRARILASEKVRWSLHTARLRLARKRKYCQFFTRFGKCNKDNGKCPYIHDSSKIAVCTKFLNGLCSNTDCKLTHKVIPDRMPDCSYFLRGLCNNKNCPYRHVHVNPNASTCEGFLKGYCVDGNECRKKHSYVCATFEATGSCPQGSKCKLHHPKNRRKGKKSRCSRKQKSTYRRYFGSMLVEDSEPQITVSESHSIQENGENGNLFIEGNLEDYMQLDVNGEEAGEANIALHEPTTFKDGNSSDIDLDDLDALIKPIRIMKSAVSSCSPG